MTAASLKEIKESTVTDMAIVKGKFEFWVNDPTEKDQKPKTHIGIYNCHPHKLTKERALKELKKVAEIIPSYQDNFGGTIHITLRANYAVNGQAYESEVDATYADQANSDLFPELMYEDLVLPTIEKSKTITSPIV